MPQSETLRANTGPEDGSLFSTGLANSLLDHMPHSAMTDMVEERKEDPITDTNFRAGGQVKYEVEKDATSMQHLDLVVELPALAIPGDGTYIRYGDWIGLLLIRDVQIRYQSQVIQEYPPEYLFACIKRMCNEDKQIYEQLAFGERSAADRNTFTAAPSQKIRIPIPQPWEWNPDYAPIVSGLASKLQIVINFNNVGLILESDGTKPSSVNFTGYWDKRVYHVNGKTRSELVGRTLTPEGISYLFDDISKEDVTIPANTLTPSRPAVVDLSAIDGPQRFLVVLIRTSAQLDASAANPAPYIIDTSLLENTVFEITSNGMHIVDRQEYHPNEPLKMSRYFKCDSASDQFVCLFDQRPMCDNLAAGSMNFSNYTLPRLSLTFPQYSSNNPELVVTVLAHRRNWLVHQRGNFQKVWR